MASNHLGRRALPKTYPLCRTNSVRRSTASGSVKSPREFREPGTRKHLEIRPEEQKVNAVASRIESMSDHQVRERYHELVDRRADLNALERFELGRIEARLDAEDKDSKLEARERQWQEERVELLNSVDDLLARLRSLSV